MDRRSFLKGAPLTALTTVAASAQSAPRGLRIAYGGIGIECSTYSRLRTRMDEFNILRGAELASSARFQFLKRYAVSFMPTLVAAAVPGGPVERKTYDAIKAEFLKRLEALMPLDGLYLPMHGAMFVDGMQDAEADWYRAARKVVGPDCPSPPATISTATSASQSSTRSTCCRHSAPHRTSTAKRPCSARPICCFTVCARRLARR